jgi:hypothetical protein
MKIGDIIKHEAFRDVAITLISQPMPLKGGGYFIKGLWVNQAFVESFIINPIREYGKVTLRILREDLSKWFICDNPKAKCIRYENWTQIRKEL